MKYIERKKQILAYLSSGNGVGDITNMCKKLYVSRSTLRRDLITLEEEGIIKRYHGGITMVSPSSSENSINIRRMENTDKKMALAKRVRTLLQDNMVIFLDSSSTVSLFIPYLKPYSNLTVITNGINIASQLNTYPNIKCYICPGVLKNKSLSIIGEYASAFISNFRADIAFISSKAITTQGIFEGDDSQALCKKEMIKNSFKTVLLLDNSKEFKEGYFKLADFSDFDVIVSNGAFGEGIMKEIDMSNCKLLF